VGRSAAPLVELSRVTQRFGGRVVLDEFSLAISPGEVVGLLGPNGAGKTTVVNAFAGLCRPTVGRVLWCGREVSSPFPRGIRRRLGVVPQNTALYDELTVADNLRFHADLYGVADRDDRIAQLLEMVGLAARRTDRVRILSGGQQRRLALARALVHDPEFLLLDEPTLGVDIDARHAIWGHIRWLRRHGKSVLLSTNYLDEAEALCDRIVALRDGRCLAQGRPEMLLARIGRCVEIDCPERQANLLRDRMEAVPGVHRVELHELGLTVHLRAGASPEPVTNEVVGAGTVHGIRVRAADMVEVFEALAVGDHAA
jgi:ABC-2 type transport system ATP-binding protein